eukprot:TRINITY_DN4068_c0_g1_i1.p1 TRINITY_DN4068_c0_g1~~TRINITY_DN4068_c0_g1_i1.p1  ORF type:complete len:165 (+),score=10.06 TRINITY_DN4068_c0_g1_i1:88-582(+)
MSTGAGLGRVSRLPSHNISHPGKREAIRYHASTKGFVRNNTKMAAAYGRPFLDEGDLILHSRRIRHLTSGVTNAAYGRAMWRVINRRRADTRFETAASQYGLTRETCRNVFAKERIFVNRPLMWNLVEYEPLIFRCLMEHVIDEVGAVAARDLRAPNMRHVDAV